MFHHVIMHKYQSTNNNTSPHNTEQNRHQNTDKQLENDLKSRPKRCLSTLNSLLIIIIVIIMNLKSSNILTEIQEINVIDKGATRHMHESCI